MATLFQDVKDNKPVTKKTIYRNFSVIIDSVRRGEIVADVLSGSREPNIGKHTRDHITTQS